jgi:pimeloyl-ACP methyl ester carboxylesterase
MATFNPYSETRVNVTNASRGPLLLIAGAEDHTVPPVLVRSALRRYRLSLAVTEIKEFAGRGHSLTIDSGWKEIADACLGWLKEKKLG